jgi:hypothetical protein
MPGSNPSRSGPADVVVFHLTFEFSEPGIGFRSSPVQGNQQRCLRELPGPEIMLALHTG